MAAGLFGAADVPVVRRIVGEHGYRQALVCGAEGLVFVFAWLMLGRRLAFAAGGVGLTAVVPRATVDDVHALPTWVILAVVGMVLLNLGTLWLAAGEVLRRRFDKGRMRWEGLR